MADHVKSWNPRQRRLAQLLAEGWPKIDAYREAGYHGDRNAGWRACRDVQPLVAELLEKVEKEWVSHQVVTREEVVRSLRETRQLAKHPKPRKEHRQGCTKRHGCHCPVKAPKPDLAAANKSDELLGKTAALFVDVHREADVEKVLDGMTDAQIDAFMREQMAKFDPNYRQTLENRAATTPEEPGPPEDVPPPEKLN